MYCQGYMCAVEDILYGLRSKLRTSMRYWRVLWRAEYGTDGHDGTELGTDGHTGVQVLTVGRTLCTPQVIAAICAYA